MEKAKPLTTASQRIGLPSLIVSFNSRESYPAAPPKAWLSAIENISKDGNDTVVIQLNAPNADLPMYLGDMHSAIEFGATLNWFHVKQAETVGGIVPGNDSCIGLDLGFLFGTALVVRAFGTWVRCLIVHLISSLPGVVMWLK